MNDEFTLSPYEEDFSNRDFTRPVGVFATKLLHDMFGAIIKGTRGTSQDCEVTCNRCPDSDMTQLHAVDDVEEEAREYTDVVMASAVSSFPHYITAGTIFNSDGRIIYDAETEVPVFMSGPYIMSADKNAVVWFVRPKYHKIHGKSELVGFQQIAPLASLTDALIDDEGRALKRPENTVISKPLKLAAASLIKTMVGKDGVLKDSSDKGRAHISFWSKKVVNPKTIDELEAIQDDTGMASDEEASAILEAIRNKGSK